MVTAAVKARRTLVQIILAIAPVYNVVLWQDGVQRACAQAVPLQGVPERSQQACEVFKDSMQGHC